jgi:hypothetical protein
MDHGSVFRRCGCRDGETGKLLGTCCPGLRSARHGSWYFSIDLPSPSGERRRVRRGGFATRTAAVAALEVLSGPAAEAVRGMTTGEWLERWLGSRVSLRASTSRGYAAHVRAYLIPHLGRIPLAQLSPGDVQAMFTAVIRGGAALGHPVSAATLHRIHATLRAALNAAVRAGLISVNPSRWPELPRAARPRPQVWTPALTERWQNEGWRPAVGVWTAGQTAEFLRRVRGHRLYALFHLVALRGLRRGEAAGLRWSDLDLDAGTLTVSGQLQQLSGRLVAGPPKSDAGRRVIALDKSTVAAAARAPVPAAGRAGRRGREMGRDRVCVHHPGRETVRAGPDDPPVPPPGRRVGAAAGHAARAEARRRHPGPGRRDRPEDRAGPARPLHDRPDRRHLPFRPARNRPERRGKHRGASVPRQRTARQRDRAAASKARQQAGPRVGTAPFPVA